ncbi:MAG: ShlB/FhaC/HecB family hemolysin secretion/activation protein [Methylobacter sp.]|jgi:hemolysin activation/secretion protein
MTLTKQVALIVVIGMALPSVALADSLPDSGRQLRQVEPPVLEVPKDKIPELKVDEKRGPKMKDGQRITVKTFKITGITRYSEAELAVLLTDAQGKAHTLAELQTLVERISHYYRDNGYLLARAYLPAQEIKDGVLEVAVLEGKLGKVELRNSSPLIETILNAPLSGLQKGEVLSHRPLERSLLLLSDIPGVEVKSTLKPGDSVGVSDLLVDVASGRKITGNLGFDTFGNRYTGEYRGSAAVNINNPFNIGDQLSLRGMGTDEAMSLGNASYQLPVGPWSTRVGGGYTDLRYQLGREFSSLEADGGVKVVNAFVLHPVVRSRNFSLYGHLGYDNKQLTDRIRSTNSQTDRSIDVWTLSLNGNSRDGLLGGGVTSYSASYLVGHLNIESVDARLNDDDTAKTNGGYGKWALNLLRLQHIDDKTSLYLSYAGQFANKNLDSSEKFILGGAYGVRAYPQGEGIGDEGYLFVSELRRDLPMPVLPGLWQALAFIDHGYVKTNRYTWVPGDNDRGLTGAGIGLNVGKPDDWIAKVNLAWKLGSEKAAPNTDRSPQVWAQVIKYF